MPAPFHDLTARLDPLRHAGAGPRRSARPLYANLTAPCQQACPAGEDIQAWLALARAGKFERAWHKLVEANPLPGVHGRVCYHPCESACNRGALDSAVSIHAVERLLGDMALEQGWTIAVPPATGKRVLVIGAGPAGLSAAWHLRRRGHAVEIREGSAAAGGMLHYGIPAYRLPRVVLAREIARIVALGVTLTLDCAVTDVAAARRDGQFDAVFLAIGAQLGKRIEIPGRDAGRMLTAVKLLHAAADGSAVKLGRRVAVVGAGNTAMDAARTARRLGAEEAVIVFISDRAHMEAHAFEAQEAQDEGVTIKWLSSIRQVGPGALQLELMALDADGTPQPTGQFETLAADAVVLALGQQADSGFLHALDGIVFLPGGAVAVDATLMTGAPGVFAGGDLVPGQHSVTNATGHGRRAAAHIDAWLDGRAVLPEVDLALATFAMLHLPIYADGARAQQAELAPAARVGGFDEVTSGLDESAARREAQRCFSCGNCFECDNCYAACPEQAIVKRGPGLGYEVLLSACTGCAVCVDQCPCHAMQMIAETAATQVAA
ncbi:NAD(P)-binding protein [Massilia sp. DWR3-1-1]|uniref:NAD(P)-binding protein n=1 Tax=Massilia sp. DWR3-1-1 TaxID=2804559 RepID=UPI003CF9BD8A